MKTHNTKGGVQQLCVFDQSSSITFWFSSFFLFFNNLSCVFAKYQSQNFAPYTLTRGSSIKMVGREALAIYFPLLPFSQNKTWSHSEAICQHLLLISSLYLHIKILLEFYSVGHVNKYAVQPLFMWDAIQPNCIVIFLLQNLVWFLFKIYSILFSEGGMDADNVPAKLRETADRDSSFYFVYSDSGF